MEQQIRFSTTSDGVRIAYATVGQGPPLIRVAGWVSHLEFEWGKPEWLWRTLEPLADMHFIVRYDGRGMGLSDRNVTDFSLETKVRDLEAVVDALGLERFSLLGQSEGGATAIAYTVRHPERVDRLLVYAATARPLFHLEREQHREAVEAALTIMRTGWGRDTPAARQFFAAFFLPDADTEAMRQFTEMQRVSASPENAVGFFRKLVEIDVTDLLPQVQAPTLVIHRRGDSAIPFDRGRELAALIPAARFLPLEGDNHGLLRGEPALEKYFEAIRSFLAEGQPKDVAPPVGVGPLTILFTDVEGSTALTQRLGDARAREVLRTHERMVREALQSHGGAEVKTMGDGFMASFGSASRALECAIAIQRAFAEYNESAEEPVHVRIGLNAGEPIAEQEDLFGTAVILAARIAAKAQGGEILASDVVRQLVAGKEFLFADLGKTALRGFEDPVRVFEVRWQQG